ncbi:Elongator complex protein [Blastocladiella emersonii ATCC 22665]|nr:Elongator complex protein [Blastocladiella emersonii ATCC 22665]
MTATFKQTHLERLIAGKEATPCVAVFDSVAQSGLPVVVEFARASLARQQRVVVFCVEHSVATWQKLLGQGTAASKDASLLTLIDVGSLLPFTSDASFFRSAVAQPLEKAVSRDPNTLVVIDHVATLALVAPSPPSLARDLNGIVTSILPGTSTLVFGASERFAPFSSAELAESLAYIAPTTLTIANYHQATRELRVVVDRAAHDLGLDTQANDASAVVVHVYSRRLRSGKLVRESVVLRTAGSPPSACIAPFPEQGNADGAPPAGRTVSFATAATAATAAATLAAPVAAAASSKSDATDPTAGLSFNLRLTDRQREAKERVVLPFMKMQISDQPGTASSSSSVSSGVIHYELDLEDDFDDDDPDADLDL